MTDGVNRALTRALAFEVRTGVATGDGLDGDVATVTCEVVAESGGKGAGE